MDCIQINDMDISEYLKYNKREKYENQLEDKIREP